LFRYKIVTFKGEQLWQGQDDDTIITLLTETHAGIKIRRRLKKNLATVPLHQQGGGFGHKFVAGAKCFVCSKTVYQAEYVGCSGKTFHNTCFKCATCDKKINQNDYSVSRDGGWRCPKCHKAFEQACF
jgi:DNA-directed RNA polymerase subunit RPC12/RpoP